MLGLAFFYWFRKRLTRSKQSSDNQAISEQLSEVNEMKRKGLISSAEYMALCEKLAEKRRQSHTA